ncbi:MAG TPA: amidohydrolase family protein [Candidatus Limnocylindria bacterium]|nr:amidohydrolase family protein [Candidatus Limnocylindria bacterium]
MTLSPVPTTLLTGGRVHSPVGPVATAMLVVDGRVAWVGSDDEAEVHRDAAHTVVALDGALVTPAFVDAHVHATSTGLLLTGLDLVDAASLAEALERLERFCRATGAAGLVLGHGWDETRWPEHRPPTRHELDRASYGSKVYLTRIDVHSAVVSSALLADLPDLAGLDGYDSSGRVSGAAHHRARGAALDSVSPAARTAAQRATRTRCAELGIGAFHELGGPEISSRDDFVGLLALAAAEPGPEVVGYWGELGGVQRARELGAQGAAGDLFADGALGSHTACLRSVYADQDTLGNAYLSAAEVRDHVAACTRAGLQAGFHAIGDGALESVVAGCEEAAALVGPAAVRAARHRIEHAEMLDAGLINRMAHLGLHASVQPVFDALWGGAGGMYGERLGPERALTLNAFADMAAAGIPLAFGSDAPVTPLGPWEAVRAAAHHHVAGQRLSVEAAFAAHTVGGWRAAGRDDAGTLVPGAPATYAVWDCGPRSGTTLPDVSPAVAAPTCLRTVVGGCTVFTREGALS